MKQMDFYMVWRQGTREIGVRHETFERAKGEAERLARANPSCTFYVLHAVGYAEQPVAPSIYHELDEIPF